jgi:hypothetical protein
MEGITWQDADDGGNYIGSGTDVCVSYILNWQQQLLPLLNLNFDLQDDMR